MAFKEIHIDNVGLVPFYKHRASKSVRIKISGSDVKVTMPTWMPYKAAVMYVNQKSDWIIANLRQPSVLENGATIGKYHQLHIVTTSSERYSSKVTEDQLVVRIPASTSIASTAAQKKITSYAAKVLQIEAEE